MNITNSAVNAQKWLKDNKYPFTDYLPLTKSSETFENGGVYGVEIPVINSFDTLQKTINLLKQQNIHCDRFNETKGTFLLSDNEIKDMLALCAESNLGITFSLSPRPEYDTKATFYRSEFGLEQCRRLNNNDAIAYSVEEALRLANLGCRGIIVYDVGVLRLLSEIRQQGLLPKDLLFKASSHCMVTNPLIAKILHEQGADSVTMVHDVSLPVLQETRRLCPKLLLDVSIDAYADKGDFIRYTEVAEIVQVASPVMLKVGASAQSNPYDSVSDSTIKLRVQRVALALEHLNRFLPDIKQMGLDDKFRCLPSCTN